MSPARPRSSAQVAGALHVGGPYRLPDFDDVEDVGLRRSLMTVEYLASSAGEALPDATRRRVARSLPTVHVLEAAARGVAGVDAVSAIMALMREDERRSWIVRAIDFVVEIFG